MPTQTVDVSEKVIKICKTEWPKHKGDCSGFVKAVAKDLGVFLSGQANDIILQLSKNWPKAKGGADAASLAMAGKFVIGGLADNPNGHLVVVVKGPLNRGKYPTAYWGQLNGVGKENTTINWSWSVADRDKVSYYYYDIGQGVQAGGSIVRVNGWNADSFKNTA